MYSLKFDNSFILLLLNAHLCKNIICIVKTSLWPGSLGCCAQRLSNCVSVCGQQAVRKRKHCLRQSIHSLMVTGSHHVDASVLEIFNFRINF